MIREDRFVQSHAPYAVDLTSFRPRGPDHQQARISAVWFRRRRGGFGGSGELVTVACAGYINECLIPGLRPAGAVDFLTRMTDGRYGGDCWARWDGKRLWTVPEHNDPDHYKKYLDQLGPMLAAWPAIPEGYDGWWTFRGR
jgi:hypothetical protein